MKSRNESELNGIVKSIIDDVYHLFTNQPEYYVVAHSFGTIIALKIGFMLEKLGKLGHLILIDGSPDYLLRLAQGLRRATQINNSLEDDLILILFIHICNSEFWDEFIKKLPTCNSLSTKVELMSEFVVTEFKANYSKNYLRDLIIAILNRLKIVMNLNMAQDELSGVMDVKLKSKITLIRPTEASVADIVEDYNLSKFSEQEISIKYVNGNHLTVLENVELAKILNEITTNSSTKS